MDTFAARKARVATLKAQVEERLLAIAPPRQGGLPGAFHHALATPGKRLRPLLLLLVATQLGAEADDCLDAACAVELVHAASLVLDDLPCMDDATLRRGEPCVHLRFGEDIAVLAAVALLNEAFALIARSDHLPPTLRLAMVEDLTAAVGLEGLVSGQEMDLRDRDAGLDALRETHHRKTGVLFKACTALGAGLGSASPAERAALDAFATELGLAFQARDDVSDALEAGPIAGGAGPRRTLISCLGPNGAASEAQRRLQAARDALHVPGGRLDPLATYVEMLLGASEPLAEAPALMATTLTIGLGLFLAALIGMEGVAWFTHRYLMHGSLWVLHRSHHEPRTGVFELNDLFAVFFACPSMVLIWWGVDGGFWPALPLGLGMTAYGAIYALFHDGLVHERFRSPIPLKLMKGLVQAHRIHHAVQTKHGAVSYGFLWAPPVRVLKARLKAIQAAG